MRERQSECPVCPSWVQCIHFEGQIIWLADNSTAALLASLIGLHQPAGAFAVAWGTGIEPCRCQGHPILSAGEEEGFPTLPDAEAEFRRREAALLGREA